MSAEDRFHSPPDDDEELPSIEVTAGGNATFESVVRQQNRNQPYSERVRHWGETQQRRPEEGLAQSLAPPTRKASKASKFTSRVQETLVSIPKEEEESLRPVSEMDSPAEGTEEQDVFDDEGGDETNAKRPNPPNAPSALRGSRGTRARSKRSGASTLIGKKTVRLSVLPVSPRSSVGSGQAGPDNRPLSFAPKRLLDIENGRSIVVSDERFLNQQRYPELDQDGAVVVTAKGTVPIAKEDALFFAERGRSLQDRIMAGDVRGFEVSSEVGILGGAWRGILRRLMLWSIDDVSALRLSRQMQLFLPFQTGYEAYIIGQVIEALDQQQNISDVRFILNVAFKNRNVSRVIVQNVGPRWDFFWHWHNQVSRHRLYDAWGQFPIVGITAFPPTENFPSTRDHALASMFRRILGPGNWITRVITQGRQGLVTDNPKNTAQNLAAESNGFELANRNQYGNYFGRRKTNEFRCSHRLPTDESIVRTFVAQPAATLTNNGVVHTLRQLAKHWHNMLFQPSGNFAHQRMEQLDPFETMRFHMPVVMVVLASLRGRNSWDTNTLGPFIQSCQTLKPSSSADSCRHLVRTMQEYIVDDLCGGVPSVIDPLRSWLDAIMMACDGVEGEAEKVYQEVTAVEIGIRLGHDLITQVSWKIPSDRELMKAISNHIKGLNPGSVVSERRVRSALLLTTPRDKRTLIELVKNNLERSKAARLLLGRVKTLLQRDVRRENLNEAIRELSMGEVVEEPSHDEWYWLEEGEKKSVYLYDAKVTGKDSHRFVHVDSGYERFVSLADSDVKIRAYIPVAEAITRAQRCFMNIELDHGKKFKYNAFMEFSYLRTALRRLNVISQVTCEELDNARLNVLREVQRSSQVQVSVRDLEPGTTYYRYNPTTKEYEKFLCKKKYTKDDPQWKTLARSRIVRIPPQSIIVVGGGPTGLMSVIHCTENVLISGGEMKLYEARDAFAKGGATFERAQIVRLDARWIAMLRYHLGTGFEDVYIPASGETDAQLGNTLPTQGFVEITIKDLENMLHVEVSKLWSKGVIQCFTDSKAKYDVDSNSLTKLGEALKIGDLILRRVDPNGNPTKNYYSWRVVDQLFTKALGLDDLRVGFEYGVFIRLKNAVLPFKLTGVDLESRTYTFKSLKDDIEDLKATAHSLPSVYPKGTKRHAEVNKVILESVRKGGSGGYARDELAMAAIQKEKFALDIGHTHVIECIGKPHGSTVHFSTTTYEPYGVCCCQGLKVSMLMHNFGEKRWGQGLQDDVRSVNDQNSRIVGDFTKMVRQAPVAEKMYMKFEKEKDENWKTHFRTLVKDKYPELCETESDIIPKIRDALEEHRDAAPKFRRQTLQTRFFETGDNYYLGMEFTREYDRWKTSLAKTLVEPLRRKEKFVEGEKKEGVDKLEQNLMHHIDRLWYEACLEVIRTGDVYNPGAKGRVPELFMINSYQEVNLGSLSIGESFRLTERPEERYEILSKGFKQIIVRNVEGYITKLTKKTKVKREGNLTRSPDGNQESRVALATFPVGHYVNHRTARLNNETRGYVFAFIGDEQATPHFMRYSGLTGACINAMLFNNFVRQAIEGVTFQDRFSLYSKETNWSNGEVVQRGTGSNYGRDGFLRPGFSYEHGLDYLHSKVIEYMETQQDVSSVLSRDWKVKFAASMVPRGMELNSDFVRCLYGQTQKHIFEKFIKEVKADKTIDGKSLLGALENRQRELESKREEMESKPYWNEFLLGLEGMDQKTMFRLATYHVEIAGRLEQIVSQVVEFATKAHLYNERVASELVNQPKPVDSIVDDFAVEAQNFANSLTMSAAFSAGALAFVLVDIHGNEASNLGKIFAAIIGGLNIPLSFSTMTNVSRYKIRNEEARILFFEEKFLKVKKAVFSLMDKKSQDGVKDALNPFAEDLKNRVDTFIASAEYYDLDEPVELQEAYKTLKSNINDPEAILEFQKKITTYFIPEVYQVNSYVQENLVDIVRALDEMHHLLTEGGDASANVAEACLLFHRLTTFTTRLEKSLQRGQVNFGFLKQRSIFAWDCTLAFKYFYSLLCCASPRRENPIAPIQTETIGIVKQAKALSGVNQHKVLRREIRDLEHLYWATRESDIASLIFVSGFLVFIASIVFSISRIVTRAGGGDSLTNVAFWATAASATGAALASFHLVRKFFILVGLWCTLAGKARNAAVAGDRETIQRATGVTFTQILLTISRLGAAGAAAVALPWAVAQNGFGDRINANEALPFWIALGSIAGAIGSTIFFFIVEYVVRYHLSPRLGEHICEAFREEIESMYEVLKVPINDIDPKQVQENETWEYVAREFLHRYRFDTVFAADRFGSILQYIQSGMDGSQ